MPTISASGFPYQPFARVTPQVPQASYQNIQATPDAFGGAVGQALSGLGQTLGQAGDRLTASFVQLQEVHNQVEATEKANWWETETNKLLYGDGTSGTGFYGMKGRDAASAFPEVRKRLEELHIQARATLQNDAQRRRFDESTRRIRMSLMTQTVNHYGRELDRHAENTFKAELALGQQRLGVAASGLDIDEFQTSLGENLRKTREFMRSRGAGDAEIEAATKQQIAQGVKDFAENLMLTDPVRAAQFIEDNRSNLEQGDFQSLQEKYRTRIAEAQEYEDVYGGARTLEVPGAPKAAGGMVRGGAIANRIAEQAPNFNISEPMALAIADIESDMGRNLGRRGNIFQLGKDEWPAVGGGQRGDPETDIKNGLQFLQNTQRDLERRLGRPPEPWEVYLGHQQGVGGAVSLLNNPNTPAGRLVPPTHISGNRGNPNAPASQFVSHWRAEYERKERKYASAEDVVPPRERSTQPRTIPPPAEGQLADAMIPGLQEKLEEVRKRIPADAPPERLYRALARVRKDANAAFADQQNMQRLQEQQQKAQDEAVMREYQQRMVPASPNYPTTAEVLADPRLSEGAVRTMVGFLERQSKPDPIAALSAFNERRLYARITAPDTDESKLRTENEINQEYIAGSITQASRDRLLADLRRQQDPRQEAWQSRVSDLLKVVGPIIAPGFGGPAEFLIDPEALKRANDFKIFVQDRVDKYVQEGKNPMDLFRSDSPEYLGHDEIVAKYKSPFIDSMNDKQQPGMKLDTLEDIRAAITSGAITREQGIEEAVRRGLIQPPAPVAPRLSPPVR